MTSQVATLHLGESTHGLRQEWLAALDTIESLNPSAVVAGHKRPGSADSPHIIEETRRYVRNFDRIADNTSAAQQLYGQMLAPYRPASTGCADKWRPYRSLATSYLFSAAFEPAEAPPAAPRET